MKRQKLLSGLMVMTFLTGSGIAPAMAAHSSRYYNQYQNYQRGYVNYRDNHPYVKKAAIGGGAGALLGGILAGDGSRMDGAIKGGLLGAGAGLGYEYLKQKGYLSRW